MLVLKEKAIVEGNQKQASMMILDTFAQNQNAPTKTSEELMRDLCESGLHVSSSTYYLEAIVKSRKKSKTAKK